MGSGSLRKGNATKAFGMPRAKKIKQVPLTTGEGVPPEMQELAQRVDRAMRRRKPRKWTQDELMAKSGVSQPTISNLLNGADPKASTVARIALALGVSTDWMLLGSGDSIPLLLPPVGAPQIRIAEGKDELPEAPEKPPEAPSERPTAAGKSKRRG